MGGKISSFLILLFITAFITAYSSSISDWRMVHRVPAVSIYTQTPIDKTLIRSGIISDQLFGVGSITKTFISALILDLEAKGKLSIQDKIGPYFPQYPRWKNITIKELLNMTSGIFNYMNDESYSQDLNQNFQKDWDTNQLIELAYKHPDDFIAGHGWNYTNTSYLLLGQLIEKVTKKPLAKTLEDTFFHPLKMHHSYYYAEKYPNDVFSQLTPGYYNGKPVKPSMVKHIGAAAGGMVMTIDDLAVFINHLLVIKDVLPKKQFNEFMQGVPIPAGKVKPMNSFYGLGVTITKSKHLGPIIWYTGVTPYHSSVYLWMPKSHQLILAMLSFNRHQDIDYDLLFPCKSLVKQALGNTLDPVC
jgi:D-alanyl-D-alanine carboxypeptidase